MKSIKNHLSLVIALLSILFSIQAFIVIDRSINAYKQNLAKSYSIIIVSQTKLSDENILSIDKLISKSQELSADNVIKRLDSGIDARNIELLKLTLPKFYKLSLERYPTPMEISKLSSKLLSNKSIIKIEDYSSTHDTTYKLLLLLKGVILVFAVVVLIVTTLLIFKELRIWQFKHNERMNIMGLFGAPVWLRSAVLFRLAIVDAVLASVLAIAIFKYASSTLWLSSQFDNIGIKIDIFNIIDDSILLFGVAISLSLLLASLIVIGHKEEV